LSAIFLTIPAIAVDANTLIFGLLAVVSLGIFFNLGKFKASKSQTEREDRIDWSVRKYSFSTYFRGCLISGLGIFLIFSLLGYLGFN